MSEQFLHLLQSIFSFYYYSYFFYFAILPLLPAIPTIRESPVPVIDQLAARVHSVCDVTCGSQKRWKFLVCSPTQCTRIKQQLSPAGSFSALRHWYHFMQQQYHSLCLEMCAGNLLGWEYCGLENATAKGECMLQCVSVSVALIILWITEDAVSGIGAVVRPLCWHN